MSQERWSEIPSEWEDARKSLLEKALDIRENCMDLSDEELVLISKIYAILFFFADGKGGKVREQAHYRERLDEIGYELDFRCRTSCTLEQQASLLDAVSNFKRIWLCFDEDYYKRLMQGFVRGVIQAMPGVDYHILQVALRLLQLPPLTECIDDDKAYGGRRYRFCIGEELFRTTLRSWAETQNDDGSWTGVQAEEAYGRIVILGWDFGSMQQVDNCRLTMLGFNYYCTTPCHTPRELYPKYRAYSFRRGLPSRVASASIMQQALDMLKSTKLTLAEKLYLYHIVLSW